MMSADCRVSWGRQPFFTKQPAYVLTHQDGVGDTRIVTERAFDGRAILCFLSPVDALIEVLQFSQIGQQYRVMPAQLVPPEAFLDQDGRGLLVNVHLGWPASDGKLMLRPSGALGRLDRTMHHWAREPLAFEFDEIVIGEVSRLHEHAGLFAWREALDHVGAWEAQRVGRVVARALASVELVKADASQCDQVALFDPEAAQWHFVPYAEARK